MFQTFDMTIDAMLLSDRQLPPDILYILEKLRPEWLPENIQTKVNIESLLLKISLTIILNI